MVPMFNGNWGTVQVEKITYQKVRETDLDCGVDN